MPRTAPAPNALPIPGMNPGTWVMGGGAGGGGGAGQGGGGSGKRQGARGGGKGKGAQGDGKGAGACGPGSGGSCPNPAHGGGGGTSAGDPIDPITGRVYTAPVTDLALGGTLPLLLERMYSSDRATEDVGLGFGWSHSFAYRIRDVPHRNALLIENPYASMVRVERPAVGERRVLANAVLERTKHGYTLDYGSRAYVFREAEKADGCYRLARVVDENANTVSLYYDERGNLAAIRDSVGRVVRVQRQGQGRIEAFEARSSADDRWLWRRRYEYNSLGQLVAALDANGHRERYTYDEYGFMLTRTTAEGLRAHFAYDRDRRCIETWCDRPTGSDGLDRSVPEVLADGSRAKGFLHVRVRRHDDGFLEVVNSRAARLVDANDYGKVERVTWAGAEHHNRFDEVGRRTGYSDGEGYEWSWHYDEEGRLERRVDPLGGMVLYSYDERGPSAVTMPDGRAVSYERDWRGNLLSARDALGEIVRYRYDERGLFTYALTPDGGETKLSYDAFGNRVRVAEPDGNARSIQYDGFGQVVSFVDEAGRRTDYDYDPMGRVVAQRTALGVWHYGYDGDGLLVRIVDPDGRATVLERGGLGVVTAVRRPDGNAVQYRYDREQDLARIIDELGAQHEYHRDAEGRVLEERTFDGRTQSYDLDDNGRIVRISYGDREFTDITYDPLGRLVERAHSDGVTDSFEYDPLGRLLRATSGEAVCSFQYDERGNLTLEETTARGRTAKVDAAHDLMGRPTKVLYPDGTLLSREWDRCGRETKVAVAGQDLAEFTYSGAGMEVGRRLPQGGVMEWRHDAHDRVVELLIGRQRVLPREGPILDWETDLEAELYQSATRTPGGMLESLGEQGRGVTTDQRDGNGRLLVRRRPDGSEERYAYDAKGLLHDSAGGGRRYGPGGRLERRGEWFYSYDGRGRLRCKERKPSTSPDPTETWTYEWSVADRLTRVVGPDVEVEFVYDSFGRRLYKLVKRQGQFESHTAYSWLAGAIVTLLEQRPRDDASVETIEWSFAYKHDTVTPVAAKRRIDGVEEDWSYWAYGADALLPLARVDAQGRILERLETTAFGEALTPTEIPFRFPGQLVDSEVGLHYHGHRYYDPETATYLSPDPLGIEAGLFPYAYAENHPTELCDPWGLAPGVTTTVARRDGTTRTGGSGSGEPLHPAVAAALPVSNARSGSAPPGVDRCGEPAALSAHLFDFEQRTGQRCDPATRAGRQNLAAALREIDTIGSRENEDPPRPRAPCPNCSQTISRLYGLAGMDPPRGGTPGQPAPSETPGATSRSRASPTRVTAGERMDGSTGTFEDTQEGSPLAGRSDRAQVNTEEYDRAVAATRGRSDRQAWNDPSNPRHPNTELNAEPGHFGHDDSGAWGRQE